jgi:tyrosyl-tRNA synthetase
MEAGERASAVLFGSSLASATAQDVLTVFEDVDSCELAKDRLIEGVVPAALLVESGLVSSRGEATRLIKQGGLYVNDVRFTDERSKISLQHALEGRVIVLRKGHRERRIVKIV